MAGRLFRFSGADVVVVAHGIDVDCLDAEDGVNIEFLEDAGEIEMSADGECGVHKVNPSRAGKIIIKSQISSAANSALYQRAELSRSSAAGYGDVTVVHTESGASFNLTGSFLQNVKDVGFGKNKIARTWEFVGVQLVMIGGGYLQVS